MTSKWATRCGLSTSHTRCLFINVYVLYTVYLSCTPLPPLNMTWWMMSCPILYLVVRSFFVALLLTNLNSCLAVCSEEVKSTTDLGRRFIDLFIRFKTAILLISNQHSVVIWKATGTYNLFKSEPLSCGPLWRFRNKWKQETTLFGSCFCWYMYIYFFVYIYIYICMLPFLATNQLLGYLRLYEGFLTPGHPHTSSELFNSRLAVLWTFCSLMIRHIIFRCCSCRITG